jgi:putative transposase
MGGRNQSESVAELNRKWWLIWSGILIEVCRYVVLNPIRAKMVETPEDWKWSSYRATAGMEQPQPCLTIDWVLGQFSRTRAKAEKEYRQFVKWGIGKETIWNEVKDQSILGEDDFVESLADHFKRNKAVPEIPKSQRFANRPEFDKLFTESILRDKRKRNRRITEAVEKHGYTQRSIADHLGVHFTYVSRILREKRER